MFYIKMSFQSHAEYLTIVHGNVLTFTKERNESHSQFSLRVETYIKALEKGYKPDKALMLASIACNKVKYGVTYRNITDLSQSVGVCNDDREPK